MAAADPATGVAGPSLVEALRARKTAVQSISAASNGGRDSQGAVDAYVSRRRAIRRRHSAVNQGRGGRVVARHIDNVLNWRLYRLCDSTVAVGDACGVTDVVFATMSAAFFQLDAFIVLNVPVYT